MEDIERESILQALRMILSLGIEKNHQSFDRMAAWFDEPRATE